MANTQTIDLRPGGLLRSLTDNWWLFLLRGMAAVAFGVLAFFWPGMTLLVLTLLWGVYALSDGILALWAAIAAKDGDTGTRWWLAFVGVAGILAGFAAFFYPNMTATVLLYMIGAWAIVVGVLQIWGAIELRKIIDNEWLLVLNGVVCVAFGFVMYARLDAGALATAWIIGWFAILAGFGYIGLAFRLKSLRG